MVWEIYNRAKLLLSTSYPYEALECIENSRDALEEIWSETACLESWTYTTIDRIDDAIRVLEAADTRGTTNFHVYYQLHELYRKNGEYAKSIKAMHRAHTLSDWPQSAANGYIFTHDYFSPNISDWTQWFDKLIVTAPINCLEIGSWQGGSATWLLDKIVGPRGGKLTCVDTFEGSSEHLPWLDAIGNKLENIFDANVTATGLSSYCRKIIGKSQDVIPSLNGENFDFIYVDGAHEAKFVIQDAINCWRLLPIGGFMLFDDIDYKFYDNPKQNTQNALDAFTGWFEDEIKVLATGRQLLLQRIA